MHWQRRPTCFFLFPFAPSRSAETTGIWHGGEEDDGLASPLDEVHYTHVVLNNGTVTLANLTVSDAVVGDIVCSQPTLAPQDFFACGDDTYLVSACNIWRGSVL